MVTSKKSASKTSKKRKNVILYIVLGVVAAFLIFFFVANITKVYPECPKPLDCPTEFMIDCKEVAITCDPEEITLWESIFGK